MIDWNRPIEVNERDRGFRPAYLVGKSKEGYYVVQDKECAYLTFYGDGTNRYSPMSYVLRNVQEKKKFWTVTFKNSEDVLHANVFAYQTDYVVGQTYGLMTCVNIVEGQYTA